MPRRATSTAEQCGTWASPGRGARETEPPVVTTLDLLVTAPRTKCVTSRAPRSTDVVPGSRGSLVATTARRRSVMTRRPGAPTKSARETDRRAEPAPSDVRRTEPRRDRAKADSFGRAEGWVGSHAGRRDIEWNGTGDRGHAQFGTKPIACRPRSKRRVRRCAPVARAKPKVKYAAAGRIAADIRKAFIGTSYMRGDGHDLTRAAKAYDRNVTKRRWRLGASSPTPCRRRPVRQLTGPRPTR